MDFLYGKLNKEAELLEYKGGTTEYSKVNIDQNLISVEIFKDKIVGNLKQEAVEEAINSTASYVDSEINDLTENLTKNFNLDLDQSTQLGLLTAAVKNLNAASNENIFNSNILTINNSSDINEKFICPKAFLKTLYQYSTLENNEFIDSRVEKINIIENNGIIHSINIPKTLLDLPGYGKGIKSETNTINSNYIDFENKRYYSDVIKRSQLSAYTDWEIYTRDPSSDYIVFRLNNNIFGRKSNSNIQVSKILFYQEEPDIVENETQYIYTDENSIYLRLNKYSLAYNFDTLSDIQILSKLQEFLKESNIEIQYCNDLDITIIDISDIISDLYKWFNIYQQCSIQITSDTFYDASVNIQVFKIIYDKYLEATADPNIVYGTDLNGDQYHYAITKDIVADSIVIRDSSSNIHISDPTVNSHAASKHYVDNINNNLLSQISDTESNLTKQISDTISQEIADRNSAIAIAIENLDFSDNPTENTFIYQVSQNNGIINVDRRAILEDDLPSISTDKINGLDSLIDNKIKVESDRAQAAEALLDESKLSKIPTSSAAGFIGYARNSLGENTFVGISNTVINDTLVQRTSSGTIKASNPADNDDTTTKEYVDTNLLLKQNIIDESLHTESKNIVDSINEIDENILNLDLFKGVFNTDTELLQITANQNCFAYVLSTNTKWIYEGDSWIDSNIPIASILSSDIPTSLGEATAGISTKAARADHVHPLPDADSIGAYIKPQSGIPQTDLDASINTILNSAYITPTNTEQKTIVLAVSSTNTPVTVAISDQPDANNLVVRDTQGNIQTNNPINNLDVINKQYLEDNYDFSNQISEIQETISTLQTSSIDEAFINSLFE